MSDDRELPSPGVGKSPRAEAGSGADQPSGSLHETATLSHDSSTAREAKTPVGDPQRSLGRYQLLERVGRGGFAEVWRSFDPVLERHVAVKLPRGDREFSRDALDSFLEEGRKLAKLNCPGIVPVLDVGEVDGQFFIVSEFVGGRNLQERIEGERLPPREAVDIVCQVADCLHRAHLAGIVHRDIKPSNILLDDKGIPRLVDFGLAVTEREQLSEPESLIGTAAYMSPEQAKGWGNRTDSRTDIYSLGVVLYKLLTGRLPYVADGTDDYLTQVRDRDPRPPRTIDDSIPEQLEQICLRCLAKEPKDRYTTARDLADNLRSVFAVRRPRANWWLLPLVAVPLVAMFVFGILLLASGGWQYRGPDKSAAVSPLELERGKWHSLLQREPEKLVWTVQRDSFAWNPETNVLLLTTPLSGMLGLCESTDASYRFRVTMRQVVPSNASMVGVFFGYYSKQDEGTPYAEFQMVGFVPAEDGNRKPRGLLSWDTAHSWDFATIGHMDNRAVGNIAVPGSMEHTLEVHVRSKQLHAVLWDGRVIEAIRGEVRNAGRLGVYAVNTTVEFSDAEIWLEP